MSVLLGGVKAVGAAVINALAILLALEFCAWRGAVSAIIYNVDLSSGHGHLHAGDITIFRIALFWLWNVIDVLAQYCCTTALSFLGLFSAHEHSLGLLLADALFVMAVTGGPVLFQPNVIHAVDALLRSLLLAL